MITLFLATRNRHKIDEIKAILGPRLGYRSLEDVSNAPEVVEDASTFAGNAIKKAVVLAKWLSRGGWRAGDRGRSGTEDQWFVLADDSGLEVDALNGAPGVHSARFAALESGAPGNSPTADNNARLLDLLRDVPSGRRTARFRCVLALTPAFLEPHPTSSPACSADAFELQTELFEGACEGRIGFEPRGKVGFGYDPLFIPEGFQETFAELGEEIKNRLSHRALALEKLRNRLRMS
jgi:XTP/dITP diphosphohydrolase